MITRRQTLLTGAGVAAMALAGQPLHAQDKLLRVATFGGSWLEAVKSYIEPAFKAATGASVEYVVGGPREALGKLAASGGQDVPFDIVEWPNDVQAAAIRRELVEKLDAAHLPNAALLQPQAMLAKGYPPAESWVVSGVIVEADKLKDRGVPTPDGYQVLREPKLAGHVALPDIRNPVAPAFLAGLAKSLANDELNIDAALDYLRGIKDPIFYSNFAVLQSRFSAGEIWALPGNLAYVVRLKAKTPSVAFVWPKIGDHRAVAQANVLDIAKGTKVRAYAVAWINSALDTKVQTAFAKATGYAPTNRDAALAIENDPQIAAGFVTKPQDIAALFLPDWDKINAAYPEWVDKWNRAMRA